MADSDRFAEPFEAESDAGVIDGLGDAVGVGHHDVTGTQGKGCFVNEAGNVLLQSEGKAEVERVVSFQDAVTADDQDLFVLPG